MREREARSGHQKIVPLGESWTKCPVIVSTPRDFRLIIVIPIAVRQESRVKSSALVFWRENNLLAPFAVSMDNAALMLAE